MDKSIFIDKNIIPDAENLKEALGNMFKYWQEIENYVFSKYPAAGTEWKFPGEKHGWSYRIKDKKRVIVYLLPREGFFKTALVFGEKATNAVMASNVAENIKAELAAAKAYAEGRGIRIDIKEGAILTDIKTLIDIKLSH